MTGKATSWVRGWVAKHPHSETLDGILAYLDEHPISDECVSQQDPLADWARETVKDWDDYRRLPAGEPSEMSIEEERLEQLRSALAEHEKQESKS